MMWSYKSVVDVACVVRVYRTGDRGVGHHWRLLVTITVWQWNIVVLDRHLVCLVLAAVWLYGKWGAWRAPDARVVNSKPFP